MFESSRKPVQFFNIFNIPAFHSKFFKTTEDSSSFTFKCFCKIAGGLLVRCSMACHSMSSNIGSFWMSVSRATLLMRCTLFCSVETAFLYFDSVNSFLSTENGSLLLSLTRWNAARNWLSENKTWQCRQCLASELLFSNIFVSIATKLFSSVLFKNLLLFPLCHLH